MWWKEYKLSCIMNENSNYLLYTLLIKENISIDFRYIETCKEKEDQMKTHLIFFYSKEYT